MAELGRRIPDCTISNEQLPNDCYKVLNQLMGPGKKKFIGSTKHKRANTSCDILNEKAGTSLSASDYGIIVLLQLSVRQGCAGNAKPGQRVWLLMRGGTVPTRNAVYRGRFLPGPPGVPCVTLGGTGGLAALLPVCMHLFPASAREAATA